MKHLFVSYEIANKLKELGFPNNTGSCLAAWEVNDKAEWLHFGSHPVGLIQAPIYQQVLDWLYKTEGIWITIEDNQHVDLPDSGFEFYINVYGFCEIGRSKNGIFNNHYQALDAAILEAIKLIDK